MQIRLVVVLALALPIGCTQPRSSPYAAVTDSVVAQFAHSPLVGFAEHHRSRQDHAFLLALINHPEFANRVNDIVVEFGSAHYQYLADRYVRGDDVPRVELQELWRGTGQWLVWDSPVYEGFFTAVRRRNASLPPEKRLRVLLGDPAISWPNVRSVADARRFAERDADYAGVVEREVLAKGRRALLIIGGAHLPRQSASDLPQRSPGVGQILEQRHPGALFVLWTLAPGQDTTRQFVRLQGSPRASESFGKLLPAGISVRRVVGGDTTWVPISDFRWPPAAQVVDAFLYLGADSTTVDPDPAIYRDPVYQTELRRRAVILRELYGMDFLAGLEALLPTRP